MPERPPPALGRAEGPDECAHCGAAIPRGARACPECGADERSGWREASVYDGLDLPDEAYDEKGESRRSVRRPRWGNGVAWYWWCVGAVLVVLLAFGALRLR